MIQKTQTENHDQVPSGKHEPIYRPLGAYRLALATLVVVGHFLQSIAPGSSEWFLLPYGTVGVMSFFLVSGYVISEAAETFYKGRPVSFAVNRLLRIFGPYWFALIITAVVIASLYGLQISGHSLRQDWRSGFYIVTTCLPWNVIAPLDYRVVLAAEPCYVIVRYIWAVVVEMQFYFAVAVALLCGRYLSLRISALVVGVIAFALYIFSHFTKWGPIYSLTYSPYFLAGFLMYVSRGKTLKWTLAAILLLWITVDFWDKVKGGSLPVQTTALMVFSTLLFIGLCWQSCEEKLARHDRYGGDLSYPLYLNHYAIEIILVALLPAGWSSFTLALFAALLLAIAAKMLVEPRLSGLRSKLRGHKLP